MTIRLSPRRHCAGLGLFWLLGFILLAFLTVLTSVQVWRAYTSKNWPMTKGVVVGFYGTPQYSYSVNGQGYTNWNVSCNELFGLSSVSNSSKYAVRYPLDAKIDVRYCPTKPSLAVLETKFDRTGIIFVIALLFMTLSFLVAPVLGRLRFRVG